MAAASSCEPLFNFWVKADLPTGQGIFSFSEYLAALALLLVVVSISDFRYRLRLTLAGKNTRHTAFVGAAAVGFAILATDFWFHNQWPVPFFLNSATNIKVTIGLIFLIMVLGLYYKVFFAPPKYAKSSATRFAEATYQLVEEGDPIRVQTLLAELGPNLPKVFEFAAQRHRRARDHEMKNEPPKEVGASNDLLLLLADPRVCKVVAQSSPWFAVDAVRAFKLVGQSDAPISGFMRNVSRAFFRNTASAIYLEESGYDSGLMGYLKQVSTEIYGDYRTVEYCASNGQSPFDLDYRELHEFAGDQADAFCRCAGLFFKSYLKDNGGQSHSYALARLMDELESLVHGLECLNEPAAREWPTPEIDRLHAVVNFIRVAMTALEEEDIRQCSPRRSGHMKDPYQYIAELIFELILKATSVSTSDFVAWEVQHNALWSRVFRNGNDRTEAIIRKRLFRLMFDEIVRMNEFPNFVGARILAYCLNVLGLNPGSRHEGYGKEEYPLRMLAHCWIKSNYRNLLENHPKVAEACLTFRVEYDSKNHQLVKTYSDQTRKKPNQSFLKLD